ncbi:MAG: relaxase domain-containing protein, partial [Promicromonosporaceae bacterium]|nr:relaxase domain-containing protein [Promicromonosporaceae bacterium]
MGKELTLGERLAGAARPCRAWDCQTTIPISSDPRKLYCSSQCRHRAAAAIRRTDRSKRAAERERDRVRDSARNRNSQRAEYHRARKSALAHVEVLRRQEVAARKEPGTTAGKVQAQLLFSHFLHPVTSQPLGNAPTNHDGEAISGFDLTFRIPKSISLQWGVEEPAVAAEIEQAHDDAVAAALRWLEQNVLATRSGAGGAATVGTRGLVTIGYKHFESRDGDPHLHTHVAVANRVQRASDGKWLTLDGRAMYAAAVAVSEVHENLLLDMLRTRLGMRFTERTRPDVIGTKAVVADLAGIDPELVDRFSSRRSAIRHRTTELVNQWRTTNQGEPPRKVMDAINAQAWAETRKPKTAIIASPAELRARWRNQLAELGTTVRQLHHQVFGHTPDPVAARTITNDADIAGRFAAAAIASWRAFGHATHQANTAGNEGVDVERYLAEVTDDDVAAYRKTHDDDAALADAAEFVHRTLSKRGATWTAFKARAETERLTRLIEFHEGEREAFSTRITELALAKCVPIGKDRYLLPETTTDDGRFTLGGGNVFDNPLTRTYTSRLVLDAEGYCMALTRTPASHHVAPGTAKAQLGNPAFSELSADQRAAAQHLVCDPNLISGLVGPAGSGKTRTMQAVRATWETRFGPGKVIGVAPSARAAQELRSSLDIDTHTLAGLLEGNRPEVRHQRETRLTDLMAQLAQARHPNTQAALQRQIAQLRAKVESSRIRAGCLIIVDEASMASTHDLAALGRLAETAGAKVALVGDPAQLDAPELGGFLGWLDRQGHTARLDTLYRFQQQWEATASLKLRAGDPAALAAYDGAGRIHESESEAAEEGAYQAVRAAQRAGQSAILIAATNDDVTSLNIRTTLERRASGEVDSSLLVQLARNTDAGVGDVVVARHNHGTTNPATGRFVTFRDTDGTPIYNGDLLTITTIHPGGSATCTRNDGKTTITLSGEYLRRCTELGYAVTAHRSQGITVDTAHLYIPYGARMTRELLYVAMTRGAGQNHVWVGLPDDDEIHGEHKTSEERPTGLGILTRALAAQGAEKTAHEQINDAATAGTSLATLVREHRVIAGYETAPRLHRYLEIHHGTRVANQAHESVAWESLVTMFRRAYATNLARALQITRIPIPGDGEPQDILPGLEPPDQHRIRRLMVARDQAKRHLDHLNAPGGHEANIAFHQEIAERTRTAYEEAHAAWQGDLAVGTSLGITDDDGAPAEPATVTRDRHRANEAEARYQTAQDPATHAANIENAIAALADAQRDLHDAQVDPAKVLHYRLSRALDEPVPCRIDDPAWIGGVVVPVNSPDPTIANFAAQNEAMISNRIATLQQQVTGDEPPSWVTQLPPRPDREIEPDRDDSWTSMALAVAIYRDLWQITTPTPLGPDADPHTNHGRHQRQASDLIETWETGASPEMPNLYPDIEPDPWDDPDYEWQPTIEECDGDDERDHWKPRAHRTNRPPRQFIPKEQIIALREHARIEDIVGQVVTLQPNGADSLKGLCPFHDEKTPSFTVRPSTGRYHCFGCNEHGDAIGFAQKAHNLRFMDAVNYLADQTGLRLEYETVSAEPRHRVTASSVAAEVSRSQGPAPNWRDRARERKSASPETLDQLAAINRAAWEYWQSCARRHDSWVGPYLEQRGLARAVTPAHAPAGFTKTLDHLRGLGFTREDVEAAGLAKRSQSGRWLDQFRDYLPIPIHDPEGRIAGFTARANPTSLAENPQFNPKYKNSPTTDLYQKSHVLAGLDNDARERLATGWPPVLCEGPMDVAAIKASGAQVVPVAPCGTAVTPEQLRLIED